MLVRVDLAKRWVSDAPKFAKIVKSEFQGKQLKKYKQTNEHHLSKLTASVSRYHQLLLTARRKKTSLDMLLGRKPMFYIVLFVLSMN